jgi:very-short-patch-repair endonuclease
MNKSRHPVRDRARELRKQMTREEVILWDLLRGRKFKGLKFRRQHPLYTHYNRQNERHYYYADFYCAELQLVIEIDGPIHNLQIDYDRIRDARMLEARYSVVRIPVSAFEDINAVLSIIDEATKEPLSPLLPTSWEERGQG